MTTTTTPMPHLAAIADEGERHLVMEAMWHCGYADAVRDAETERRAGLGFRDDWRSRLAWRVAGLGDSLRTMARHIA